MVKNLPANAGYIREMSLIPGSGRSPGEEHGNPLQSSCVMIKGRKFNPKFRLCFDSNGSDTSDQEVRTCIQSSGDTNPVTGASQVALVIKNPPANAGDVRDPGSIPGREDPLEEGMATHSSILACRIPMDRDRKSVV